MPDSEFVSRSLVASDLVSGQFAGNTIYANADTSITAVRGGKSFDSGFATIQAAIDAAVAGDRILIAPGDYVEAVTITKDNLTLIGVGSRGSVAIAPGGNGIAIIIDGSTSRVEEVTLINVGGEGAGTGGGLYIKGDIRRLSFSNCKFEGGAFASKLESTAAGSVADITFDECEFGWTTTGMAILSSGGGDPVTQVRLDDCFFHNCATDGILSSVSAPANLELFNCKFDDDEAGTAPTHAYIGAAVAGTSGTLVNCSFPVAINGGKVLLAATLIALGCYFTGGINTTAPT